MATSMVLKQTEVLLLLDLLLSAPTVLLKLVLTNVSSLTINLRKRNGIRYFKICDEQKNIRISFSEMELRRRKKEEEKQSTERKIKEVQVLFVMKYYLVMNY